MPLSQAIAGGVGDRRSGTSEGGADGRKRGWGAVEGGVAGSGGVGALGGEVGGGAGGVLVRSAGM